jgi:GNAT superfamily N-acetyltransferase
MFWRKPISLNSFYEVKLIRRDSWNGNGIIGNGNGKYIGRFYFKEKPDLSEILLENPIKSFTDDRKIFDELATKSDGFITYKLLTGQIGLFYVAKQFQHKGVGKQILTKVIDDMKNEGRTSIFAITYNNHLFWSNVFHKSFVWKTRPNASVTGSGYFLSLIGPQHHQHQ